MAPVNTPAKVLVTGANGYIAMWVIRALIERGASVKAVVRSPSKALHILKIFGEGKVEIVVVAPDMTKDGAFDEAVKGVDAIAHIASPADTRLKTLDGRHFQFLC